MLSGLVSSASAASGIAEDFVRYFLCLSASIPLGFLFRSALPHRRTPRNLYCLVFGLLFVYFALGAWTIVHLLVVSGVTYAVCLALPSRLCPPVVLAFVMGYLSLAHIYRLYTDYLGWSLDFTGPLMIQVQQLSMFACQFYDGRRMHAKQKLEDAHLATKALPSLPPLLDYFSWVFCYFSVLAGPAWSYREYEEFVTERMYKTKDLQGRAPSTLMPTLWALLRFAACVPPFVVAGYLDLPGLFATPSSPFFHYSWLRQVVLLNVVMCCWRQRYYMGWYLAEAGFTASGANYNGVDANGARKWDRVRNVNWMKVEFGENVRSLTVNWNCRTAYWLRYYVYIRLPEAWATVGTYFVSAFWHGFYPGYYVLFLTAAYLTIIARIARRRLRPRFLPLGSDEQDSVWKTVYDIVGMYVTVTAADYIAMPFLLLSWGRTWVFLRGTYFLPYLLAAAFHAYLLFVDPVLFKRKAPSEKKKSS